MDKAPIIGAVVIGRNEGDRLRLCLTSLADQVQSLVYVDSGSTDGSIELAESLGVTIVPLDLSKPFTAARARNAGLDALLALPQVPSLVQFVDGDCEVQKGWIDAAVEALQANPKLAVVCGRRRERFPEASVYNQLIDAEWDTPIGPAKACGGDALMRVDVLRQVEGFNPSLIAGEEPELCVRIRAAGWQVERIDQEMTLHDAALTKFSQWWTRIKRGGHAFAEGAAMHGTPPERHFVTETKRAVVFGGVLPLVIILGAIFVTPWALLGLLYWPLQILRMRRKGYDKDAALFLTLAKFPEALGVASYWKRRLLGGRIKLIEYK